VTQVVELLPTRSEALSSNSSTTKKEKKERKEFYRGKKLRISWILH
jgi:hypothetical protein